nr:protein SIX6OS1 isoform X2 [Pogona vitticeps]XP_020669343.1 protein SIX6OS1 isoform X2 [Pogona vitticeps]
MNDMVFSNLDKLLVQLVFQTEQASYAKEHERQQIKLYAANILEKKGEICRLQEDIHKNDEVILSLQKQNNNSKENCNAWKPAYMILNKHEEYLQKKLQDCQETTEKDKKMYQDYMNQYKATFKQHEVKFSETAIVQEYIQEKKEFEEIQNRVLKMSELFKQKECKLRELQEPGPFLSLSSWALHIASLRQNTKETLMHAADLRQQSLELDKTVEGLEKKMNYFQQQLEEIAQDQSHPEDQNHLEVASRETERNLETGTELDGSVLKENHHLFNEKQQKYTSLHLPSISRKEVHRIPTVKPMFQHAGTAKSVEEKENIVEHSTLTSVYFSHVESENQKCNDTAGTNISKPAQISSVTRLQNQTPFRLLAYQKQPNSKQWLEPEVPETANTADYAGREGGNKSKDSANTSQDGHKECYSNPAGNHSAEREESTESFPRTPEPNILSKTSDSGGMKTPFDLLQSENEGSMSKSPAFSFLTCFTSKSPGFNFFDSSAFGAEISPNHQSGESSSAGHLNPISPQKDIGDLFGKMNTEDSFAFSFPSCSSAQVFQDGKDDFSFPFAFGSSQSASLKDFQSSSQSRKTFSFF